MKILTCFMLIAGLSLPPTIAHAKIYKTTDEQGNVVFTDVPEKGAEQVDLPPISTFTPPPLPQRASPQPEDTPVVVDYKVTIVAPKNEATIWDNLGNIVIQLQLEPKLQTGDTLEILLDGETVTETESSSKTTFQLTGVERGEHTLSAQVMSNEGDIIANSTPIVVFLHRTVIRN